MAGQKRVGMNGRFDEILIFSIHLAVTLIGKMVLAVFKGTKIINVAPS